MNDSQKFRVWCEYHKDYEAHAMMIDKEGWLYHVKPDGGFALAGPKHVVEWSTGIRDAKEPGCGELIYDGDICAFPNGDKFVVHRDDHAEFFTDWIGDPKCEDQVRDFYRIGGAITIGNIHQNPELLEVTNGTD